MKSNRLPKGSAVQIVLLGITLLWCAGGDGLQAQPGFVLETDAELSLTADFNGDGREDAAVVNRGSGGVLIGLGNAGGGLNWFPGQPAGLSPVSSIGAGRWFNINHDSLAFAGSLGNRVHWVAVPGNPGSSLLSEIQVPRNVPWMVAPLDVGGAGNTPFDDFIVLSIPGPGFNSAWVAIRNANGNPGSAVIDQLLPAALSHLNRIAITPDAKRFLAATHALGPDLELRAWDFSSGASVQVSRLTNLPPAAHYIVGRFGPANEPMAVAFTPGSFAARMGVLDQPLPVVRTGKFDPPTVALLGGIAGLRTLAQPTRPQIVALGTLTGSAAVLAFDGLDSFTRVQALTIPGQESVTGCLTFSDGGFQVLTGTGGVSANFHRFRRSGTQYVLAESGPLPKVDERALGANVFQFDHEPFVNARPGLLRTDRVADWTSQFVLGGSVEVTFERFAGGSQGLDNPAPRDLGAPHPLADFGLVNQHHEALSLFTFSTALGTVVSEVGISPAPGTYRSGVSVSFTTTQPGHQVFYRRAPFDAWQLYGGAPLHLFTDTTVEYFGKPIVGNAKSVIHQARYDFLIPPGRLDSDQDGVPDFVEQHLNLDPAGGADTDQDSFRDLEEILAGTNPAKAASAPGVRSTPSSDAGISLALRPLPVNPVTGSTTGAAGGTSVRLLGFDGNQFGFGQVAFTILADPPVPAAALLAAVRPDHGLPFLVAATDPHFAIVGQPAGSNQGRELIALIRMSPPAEPTLNYTYGSQGGSLGAEAGAWIDAVIHGMSAAAPSLGAHSISPRDALVARLFERGLALGLLTRGVQEATNLTLFPFRLPEAGRWVPPLDIWRGGAQFDDTKDPPPPPLGIEELTAFHDSLSSSIKAAGTPQLTALVNLTDQIYLLSSRSNHITPPGRYPLPMDALRQFIWNGTLPAGYEADLPVSANQRAQASAAVAQAVSLLPVRERVDWVLRVRSDSFSGFCATLETTDPIPSLVHLFDSQGESFLFPDTFLLLPGSLVRVDGYRTAAQGPCPGTKVEVLAASLQTLPADDPEDTNLNGISDDWERLFLGGLSNDPMQDSDKDLVSDLDEFLGGSDPNDPGAIPLIPAPDITPPDLEIVVSQSGEISVEWAAKGALPAHLNLLNYVVLSGIDLDSISTPVVQHPAGGTGRVSMQLPPPSNATAVFYRLALCWGGCAE